MLLRSLVACRGYRVGKRGATSRFHFSAVSTLSRYLCTFADPQSCTFLRRFIRFPVAASLECNQQRFFAFWKSWKNDVAVEDDPRADVDALVRRLQSLLPATSTRVVSSFFSSTTRMPMVMLLGNHSSGKSSVVNYITGRDIQQTGVAPTDDGFTMIQRGHVDMDEDGFAATSNKDLFLEDLKPYGSNFLTRFKLKTREMPEDSKVPMNLILLDTPGMIDTPVQVSDRRSVEGQLRGYDFLGVTRWFAQRSDLIVFFFDPSNPGTTGETLDVLSSSLKGMEHKIVLVLHKTDVFDRVTDFGRCYGALCYNLSKVLETKDLPFLYTTGLPTFLERKTTVVPREEILMQMSEVLQLIASAETHKVDTILSNAEIGIRGALLLSKVTEELLNARQHVYMVCGGSLAAVLLAGTLYSPVIGIAIASIMAFLVSPMKEFLRVQETHILQSLDAVAQKHLAGASGTREVWETSLKPTLQRVIKEQLDVGLSGFPVLPSLDRSAKMELRSILAGDIPKLRIDIRQLKLDMKTKLKSSYARKLNEESVPPGSIDG